MTQHADSIIKARWVIPAEPYDCLLDNHALVIHHGRIKAILPNTEVDSQFTADKILELYDHALIPGLINAHTHAAMNLFKGIADDLPLMDWLNNYIWPAEQNWVSEEFVADGSRLAIAEMIKSGVTCFNDMYFFPDQTARVAAEAGMRASVGMIVIDFPSAWAADSNDYFNKGLRLHDEYRDHPLITTALAPHAPYSVNDESLKRVQMLANELDCQVHMHVHETAEEVSMSLDNYKVRPLKRLEQLNMLTPALITVHMTQLEEDEIEQLAASGSHVVHCPQSNMKLASGFCPVDRLLKAGINVALGTDSSASNNTQNLLQEMQFAAKLGKGVAGNPQAIPAYQALQMATINGAKALGLETETGSLTAGKAADITAIKLSDVGTQPAYNPVSQIVYAASRENISHVWVNGKSLLSQGQLITLDEKQLINQAKNWQAHINMT